MIEENDLETLGKEIKTFRDNFFKDNTANPKSYISKWAFVSGVIDKDLRFPEIYIEDLSRADQIKLERKFSEELSVMLPKWFTEIQGYFIKFTSDGVIQLGFNVTHIIR